MSNVIVNKELHKLEPTTLVELFDIDTTTIDGNMLPENQQVMHFHNFVSDTYLAIYFGGVKYSPVPIKYSNNEIKGDSTTLPRPRISIGNADGIVSQYMMQTDYLIGAQFTRRRTFARFLDGTTWGMPSNQNPMGTPNSEAVLSDDIFFIDKIVAENKQVVEFELASILELHKIKLPRGRMWANSCRNEYRNSSGCGYSGVPVADASDKKFADAAGYNMTLTDRGAWSSLNTYNRGDYVTIKSPKFKREDGADFKVYYYVALEDGIQGQMNRPTGSPKWKLESCSRKINGCLCRYAPTGLPFGAFPALVRVEFDGG